MPVRTFTVTFNVAEDEYQNFMTRLAGGTVLSNEIPRSNTTTITTAGEDDGDGPADANAPAVNEQGVPWDARYHGAAKKINADKSWKRIKGLTDAQKAEADAFEAAAKAAFTAPVVETVVTAAPTVIETALPVVVETPAPAPVVGLPVTAPAVTTMPGLPMPAAVVTPPPVSYEEVVAKFGAVATTHPFVTSTYEAIYAECGINDANKLTTDETLRRKLFDKLTEIGNTPAVAA